MGSQVRLPLCSHPFVGAGRDRDHVHKRLLPLQEGKDLPSLTQVRLTEFQLREANNLMHSHAKRGNMVDAGHVFDTMPERNVASWNIVIFGHAKLEEGARALELYARMYEEGVQPNSRTLVAVLKACSSLAALEVGKQVAGNDVKSGCLPKGRVIHSQVVKSGCDSDVFVGTTLVHMYAKYGSMEDARRVFDDLQYRDVVTWNSMILGYAEQEEGAMALTLHAKMQQESVQQNARTFVGSLKACSSLAASEDGKFAQTGFLTKGRAIHSQAVKTGVESDIFVGNTLVNMYGKCRSMEDAQRVFDELPRRDVVTWNTMILGYAEQEDCVVALGLYTLMHQQGVPPNARTFVGALKAYNGLAALEEGKLGNREIAKSEFLVKCRAIHSQAVTCGFDSDVFVGTSLVDVYANCGSMGDARSVFNKLPHRNVVTWNAMIMGYAEQEDSALAFELYARIRQEGVKPNDRTFVGALKACTCLTVLEEVVGKFTTVECMEKGKAIHSEVIKSGFESDVYVGNTLVYLYAKCGSLEDARRVFDELRHRDVITWTNMILGYAEQEENKEAFSLYAQMREQGLSPSSITFVAILIACGNASALETGKEVHFHIKTAGFETIPMILATSLIGMYAKCGSMVAAQEVFDSLPERDTVPWSALIAGYARQGESEQVFLWFERMRQEGIHPDPVTFLSILSVCSHAGLVEKGQEYFRSMSNLYGIIPTMEHYTCMVDILSRAGRVDEAVGMIKNMPFQPNVVVWLTVLAACRKWKNVEVGRYAFENVVRLDEKFPTAYVLMADIYADADMQEDHDRILIMRKDAQAWKEPGQNWWTDLSGMVHTFLTDIPRAKIS